MSWLSEDGTGASDKYHLAAGSGLDILTRILERAEDTILTRNLVITDGTGERVMSLLAGNRRVYRLEGGIGDEHAARLNMALERGLDASDQDEFSAIFEWFMAVCEGKSELVLKAERPGDDAETSAFGVPVETLASGWGLALFAAQMPAPEPIAAIKASGVLDSCYWCEFESGALTQRHQGDPGSHLAEMTDSEIIAVANAVISDLQGPESIGFTAFGGTDDTRKLLMVYERTDWILADISDPILTDFATHWQDLRRGDRVRK